MAHFIKVLIFLVASCSYAFAQPAASNETPPSNQASNNTSIYLFRHAEKSSDGTKNPKLNALGKKRAEKLAAWLADKNITAIYSTNYKRTQQTVKPLATQLNLTVISYNPRNLKALAEKLKQRAGNSVVVGHSNTTPELVTLLGGNAQGSIDESEYDRLYQIDYLANKQIKSQLYRQK